MVVVLPPRRRLRCLLAMALFAWLMLAVAPPGARPREAPQGQAGHAAMHTHEAGCCADHAGEPQASPAQACHCALPCAGVLPSLSASLAAVRSAPARYAPPRSLEAPLSGFSPPLRPPLA